MTPEQQTPASVVERPWTPGCTELLKSIADDANFADWMTNPTMPEFLRSAAALIERLSAEREGLREALKAERDWHERAWDFAMDDARECAHREEKGAERLAMDRANGHHHRLSAIDAALTQGESRQSGETPEAVALSDMREIAVGLGYPSILEALEDLDRLKSGWQDIATGDPLAWHIRRRAEDAGFGRPQVFTTDDASEGDLRQWRRNGYEVTPLYALPAAPTPADGGGE